MAIITTTTNLSSVTYTSGEVITLDGGPDKVLTINSQPPLPIGSLSCLNAGKIRIENTSTTTPIVIQFAAPANRFAIKAIAVAEIQGNWIVVGTGNNTSGQVIFNSYNVNGRNIDFPSYIEVETGNGTGIFTPHFLATIDIGDDRGHIYSFTQNTFGSGYFGQVLFFNPTTGNVTCGDGVNGNRIPVGARVRIPNIHITGTPVVSTLTTAITAGVTPATIAVTSAASFNASGEVQIGTARFGYTGKTASSLTGVTLLYQTVVSAAIVGSTVRQILSPSTAAQFDTATSGSVSIDKCSFGIEFCPRFLNPGNITISNAGSFGQWRFSSWLGYVDVSKVLSQFDTRVNVQDNTSHFAILSGIGPGRFSDIYIAGIASDSTMVGLNHNSQTTTSIKNIHVWAHKRSSRNPSYPTTSTVSFSRTASITGSNGIAVVDVYSIGLGASFISMLSPRVKNVYLGDNLDGSGQSAFLFVGLSISTTKGVFQNIKTIGTPTRGQLIQLELLSQGNIIHNKGSELIDLKNQSSIFGIDLGLDNVYSYFSIINPRNSAIISQPGSKNSVARKIAYPAIGSLASDGLAYGTGLIADNVAGVRRSYSGNSGCLDYSPFAVVSIGSLGALTCGMFGGESSKSIYQITGTAYLNNAGGIILPAIGDSIIATNIDAPLMAITGFTGAIEYQGTTPATGINYDFSMRAWGASAWGGWQVLTIANLNAELALITGYNPDEIGLDFRLRMTAATASATRVVNEIVLPTTISQTYNPSVWKIDASLYAPIGANYLISNGVKTLASGTIAASPTMIALPSDFDGTVYQITTQLRRSGFIQSVSASGYDYDPIDIRLALDSVTAYTDTNVSGIAFNKTSKTITISQSVTTSNLFDSLSRWFAELANFDTQSFFSAGGGLLSLTDGWNIALTATGSINPGSTLRNIEMNGLFTNAIGSSYLVQITDTNGPKYPPITFTGFPVSANSNGKLPESVFGIKNEVTGVWTTFDASSGSVSVSLSTLGLTGHTFTIVADAKGYYRTPEITGVPLDFSGQDFANLFEKMTDSDGNDLYGRGIQAEKDRIVYNAADATFDLEGGPISFSSAIDKKEEITSSQSAITTMDTEIVRSMRFNQNPYAKTVQMPSPLKVRANATTTTAPILLDFNIVEAGNVNGDPYIHSSRPEVQVRLSKIISDPSALSNLAIIPALL